MIEVVQVLVVQNLQLFSIYLSAGGITFGDFMEFLSIMSKGTTKEKILWSFDFLDIDRNGHIEKQELTKVTLPDSNNVYEYVYQIFLVDRSSRLFMRWFFLEIISHSQRFTAR